MKRYRKGAIKALDLKSHIKRNHHKKDKNKKYYDDIFTFDIETTSAFLNEKGEVITYEKGKSDDYWNSLTALSLCYEWTFGIGDVYFYGRELTEFKDLLDELPKDGFIYIWVHNLSFEFHFLTNILKVDKIFARNAHKPIKCSFKEHPLIEFRCTYMLTRLSLAEWAKQIGTKKLVGDLDYNVLRTPLSKLTKKEKGYCQRDCEVVYRGISDYLKRYKTLDNIPLTQTGTVRREVKARLTCYPEYVREMKKLIPKDAEQYQILQDVFAGGYTHANRKFAGQVQEGLIEHYDFTSSYPTVMCCEKYPSTPWAYTGIEELPDINTFNDYAYLIEVEFYNIESRLCNTYIQQSKSDCTGARWDNGRLIKAERCRMWLTEQDLLIIMDAYKWKDIKVYNLYKSVKQYLPKIFVEYVLKLYGNKTTLKGVDGMEALYLQSKQYVNSLFGMMVTAIVQSDIHFDPDAEDPKDLWQTDILTADIVNKHLDKLRNFSPREKRYFLSYSWGIYVCAYARRNIWKLIAKYDSDVIYTDTDSNFFLGHKDVSWYNIEITEKLKRAAADMGIDFKKYCPANPKGEIKQLGVFDKEHDCTEFLTLGAKRYVYRDASTGKLMLTVSGINKDAVHILNDNIYNFKDGLCFDKDYPTVHKQMTTYCYHMPDIKYPDGYISTYRDGINLRPTGYTITITAEYNDIINKFRDFNFSELPDAYFNHLRGRIQ